MRPVARQQVEALLDAPAAKPPILHAVSVSPLGDATPAKTSRPEFGAAIHVSPQSANSIIAEL
jgi:hypothetical protein